MDFEWTPEFWQGWRESNDPYRKYKSTRDRRIVLQLLGLRDGERVLEVGCGYGWISQAMWVAAKIDWTGVDRSAEMIRSLRETHPVHAQRALLADAGRLPFKDSEFDKVVCTGVLMHIAEDKAAVRELVRVLRPGGGLLCSINNALSPYSFAVRLWNQHKKGFIQKFLRPELFRGVLRDAGVQTDSMTGDGIIATVPLKVRQFSFPPARAYSAVCRLDAWVTHRFPWLAYELWFHGTKVTQTCAF